jgi:hypothetical protein
VIDRLGKITGHKCQASAQAGFGFGAPEGAATDDCLFMAGPSGTIEATVESIVQSVRRPTKQKDRPKAVAVATGKLKGPQGIFTPRLPAKDVPAVFLESWRGSPVNSCAATHCRQLTFWRFAAVDLLRITLASLTYRAPASADPNACLCDRN